jgi:hypothetical protein
MNMRKSRMTKLVVLVVILAMIFGGIAASLVALFAGPGSVVGTYVASDGRKLVLDKKGMATISLPSGGQSGQAPYKVKGGSVVITASSGGTDTQEITLKIDGQNLVVANGGQTETWVRQSE